MKNLNKTIREHALNAEDMKQTMMQQLHIRNKRSQTRNLRFVMMSLSLVFALVMGILFTPGIGAPTQVSAYAMVSVDINPSFELYVDEDKHVIEIKAVNDDALTIDTSDWIGLAVEDVIVELIAKAKELGFIQSEDDEEDYILVTTVLLDEENEDEEYEDSLGQRIQAAIEHAGELEEGMHVAIIKATLREKFEAEGKEVPLGLYVIRGFVEEDDEWIKVSDFVKEEKNVQALEKKASRMVHNRNRVQEEEPEGETEENREENQNHRGLDDEDKPTNNRPENPQAPGPSNRQNP